jgi:PHD/YefM family antitoxin component YafN of YafNO toxin-antitoxin module
VVPDTLARGGFFSPSLLDKNRVVHGTLVRGCDPGLTLAKNGTQLWYNKAIEGGLNVMPKIIPIRDLKNTSKISRMCHESDDPIFVTKNGYGDIVIMSMKVYKEKMFMSDIYHKLNAAEEQLAEGKVLDGDESLKKIRDKFNV